MTSKAKRTDRYQCRVQRLEAGAEMSDVNALEFKEELRRQVARLDPWMKPRRCGLSRPWLISQMNDVL